MQPFIWTNMTDRLDRRLLTHSSPASRIRTFADTLLSCWGLRWSFRATFKHLIYIRKVRPACLLSKLKKTNPLILPCVVLKRSCEKAGILSEVRRREHYEKPTAVRKRQAAAAVKRHLKKLQREQRRRERLY